MDTNWDKCFICHNATAENVMFCCVELAFPFESKRFRDVDNPTIEREHLKHKMATIAQNKRESSVAKLRDSVWQLRCYLDDEKLSERFLQQKCNKVDADREELIAKHAYAEKMQVSLDDEEMSGYLTPKIDEAVEATEMMEEMSLKERRKSMLVVQVRKKLEK